MGVQAIDHPKKLATGITGFDVLAQGGLPIGKMTLVIGGVGTGKTVFSMQMAANAARAGYPGVFITFDESSHEVVENAASFNWKLAGSGSASVHVLDGDLGPETVLSGPFDLTGLIATLEAHRREVGVRWVILDGIDTLLGLMSDPVGERREIYRLRSWLREHSIVGLLTAKEEPSGFPREIGQADGLLAFAADCVVRLSATLVDRVLIRGLRIIKHRGAGGPGGEYPVMIGDAGMSVGYVGLRADASPSSQRVSTGVAGLDAQLRGGYLRGGSVLISGEPGAGKSILVCAYAQSATQRNERVLMVLLGECSVQVRSHMKSVGINLEGPSRSGTLRMESLTELGGSVEDLFVMIAGWIEDIEPRHLIIDPISALLKAGGSRVAGSITRRLIDLARRTGVTVVFTTMSGSGVDPESMEPASSISPLADTWISIGYPAVYGERSRLLLIVKSRGSGHCDRPRELLLSTSGPMLADNHAEGGTFAIGGECHEGV